MRSTAISGAMALLCVAFWPNATALADGTALPGIRPLGTGGAMRAAATGDAGPMLNPSGIVTHALLQCGKPPMSTGAAIRRTMLRVSLVDSTSGSNLGGALFYTYHKGLARRFQSERPTGRCFAVVPLWRRGVSWRHGQVHGFFERWQRLHVDARKASPSTRALPSGRCSILPWRWSDTT